MNFSKSIFAIALAGLVMVGCKKNTETTVENSVTVTKNEPAEPVVAGNIQKVSFTIKGMTCAVMCAAKIEKELAAMDGVQNAKVDFDKETATVEFDDAKETPEQLVAKVESVADGKTYKVSNLKTIMSLNPIN